MKPTKMRNNAIYRATYQTRSKQLGSALSKELQKKYGKRSVRVVEGDNVAIVRGEFAGVDGKVSHVSTQKGSVAIEGIKKEQTRGEKYDVYIHTSNLVIKSLNTEDKWRMAKLEGKDPRDQSKVKAPKDEHEMKEEREEKHDMAEESVTDQSMAQLAEKKGEEKSDMIEEDEKSEAEAPKVEPDIPEKVDEPKVEAPKVEPDIPEKVDEPKVEAAEEKEKEEEPKETKAEEKSEKKEDDK